MPILIDLDALRRNLEQLWTVIARTHSRILLDQTALPAPTLYPLLGLYLSGTTGRTQPELEQGLRHMDRDSHGHPAPDCSEADFTALVPWCSHLTFATLAQWRAYGPVVHQYKIPRAFQVQATDHCVGGIPLSDLPVPLPKGISGLRIQLGDPTPQALSEAIAALEARFGGPPHLFQLSIGGGWPLTDPDFPLSQLEDLLNELRARWGVMVLVEVGEAVTRGALSRQIPADAPAGDLLVREGGTLRPFTTF